MKRGEALLREACARLAEEETQQLQDSLTDRDLKEAEGLFRRHQKRALFLIAQSAPKPHRRTAALRVAACLLLAGGALWISLSRQAPDPPPLAPVYTASVAPYLSPAPTPAPTAAPTVVPTLSPTRTPEIPCTSTPSPTADPTSAPTDVPSPTIAPQPTSPPSPGVVCPADWTGCYFPAALPGGYQWQDTETGDQYRAAVYRAGTETIVFTEYDASTALPISESASLTYVQWGDGAALRMETESGVTLAWEMDGRTLSLFCSAANTEEIASSVEKISVP